MLAMCHNEGRPSPSPFCFLCGAALFAGASHNGQDVEENVDDVSVEVEGSKNILLWTQSQLLVAQEELSVHSQKLQRRNKDGISYFKRHPHLTSKLKMYSLQVSKQMLWCQTSI